MKYKVEIEGPEGCKPVVDGTTIRFVPCKPDWQEIKTVEQVIDYCEKYFKEESRVLIGHLRYFDHSDYEYWFSLYRLIVMAITDNEKVDLIKGNLYYPCVQFCRENNIKNCWGDKVAGHITYQGARYAVVGGDAHDGSSAGLGCFNSGNGVSFDCECRLPVGLLFRQGSTYLYVLRKSSFLSNVLWHELRLEVG